MSFVLMLTGILAVAVGIYVFATSIATDIQLTLGAVAVLGGLGLIGLGSIMWRLDTVREDIRDLRRDVLDQPEE